MFVFAVNRELKQYLMAIVNSVNIEKKQYISLMKSYCIIALLIFLFGSLDAQTTVSGSFIHGGITRTYSFYVPASYTPGSPVPMVIGLHGLSSSGADFAQNRDFRPIADTANFIMVHPDGSAMLGVRFWNYGNILGSTVDDVGFLEALIDTISASYSINPQRILRITCVIHIHRHRTGNCTNSCKTITLTGKQISHKASV